MVLPISYLLLFMMIWVHPIGDIIVVEILVWIITAIYQFHHFILLMASKYMVFGAKYIIQWNKSVLLNYNCVSLHNCGYYSDLVEKILIAEGSISILKIGFDKLIASDVEDISYNVWDIKSGAFLERSILSL